MVALSWQGAPATETRSQLFLEHVAYEVMRLNETKIHICHGL